jgi:hypothetical protein
MVCAGDVEIKEERIQSHADSAAFNGKSKRILASSKAIENQLSISLDASKSIL